MKLRAALLALTLLAPLGGCVTKAKHDALQSDYNQTTTDMRQTIERLEAELATASTRVAELEPQVAALSADKSQLSASVTEMERALAEQKARQAQAEARIAEYSDLLSRFKSMIDSGTLKVKIVDGRMVVAMATDILFASGSARLSTAGKEAVGQVASVLQTIPKRQFQVEGHSDNVPISNESYSSNWDLAYDRALGVVQTMIDGGLAPERLSAASFGEFRPVVSNDTPEGQKANRRIEIVVVPDLASLPGFDELNKMSNGK